MKTKYQNNHFQKPIIKLYQPATDNRLCVTTILVFVPKLTEPYSRLTTLVWVYLLFFLICIVKYNLFIKKYLFDVFFYVYLFNLCLFSIFMDMVKNMFTFKKCYSLYLKTIEFRNISLWYQLQKKLIEKMV